jgi:hypothetical protein
VTEIVEMQKIEPDIRKLKKLIEAQEAESL